MGHMTDKGADVVHVSGISHTYFDQGAGLLALTLCQIIFHQNLLHAAHEAQGCTQTHNTCTQSHTCRAGLSY